MNTSQSFKNLIVRDRTPVSLSFAGQGMTWLDDLATLDREVAQVNVWVDAADAVLCELAQSREFSWSGHLPSGFSLKHWLRDPTARPLASVLSSSVISQPGIFITQIARFAWLRQNGFDVVAQVGSGHSQGVMPVLLISLSPNGQIQTEKLCEFVRIMAWQGLCMARSAGELGQRLGEASPMAAISGPDTARLAQLLAGIVPSLPEAERPVIALFNTRTRHVLSGAPRGLIALEAALKVRVQKEVQLRKEGKLGGKPLNFTWEWLDVAAPFHGPNMAPGLTQMEQILQDLKFSILSEQLQFPVLSTSTALPYAGGEIALEVMRDEFVRPVQWVKLARALTNTAEIVLDFGPGDGVAKLTMSVLRGSGKQVAVLGVASGQRQWQHDEPRELPENWNDFSPTLALLPDGTLAVDNKFSRATGQPPVLLPGMTPTTVDAPIVAAAANAGFWSELAGGGQPTQKIFLTRMQELAQLLQPGREVVLNALFLDPYLWDLHVKQGLVVKARKMGLPLSGICVSAGVPEVEDAVRLIGEWVAAGLHQIAFKPGTLAQIDQVVRIATAVPDVTLFVHVEGGKAGGHHSWEDLEQLLLDGYVKLRSRPNIVLCVGGGIADEKRAIELLTGTWSLPLDMPRMPVDAIFLGTMCMACKEATASPQVKQALVDAGGTAKWVHAGDASGGVTSGKSQLGADIHYLDNAAARVGRLLDSVAGDGAAVLARHAEIAAALAQTAKPWFGDLEQMTWLQVLERAVELLAIGNHTPYDDGAWPDPSYRDRVRDLLQLAEARLADPCQGPYQSLLQEREDTDDPALMLQKFAQHWPTATAQRPMPPDVQFFIDLCARPGKPVPFVPIIDADVRRWYKSDALWQAQDPRYAADAVLVIPGPEAVAGILQVDEPIADLLGRFDAALIAHLQGQGQNAAPVARLGRRSALLLADASPTGIVTAEEADCTLFTAVSAAGGNAWLSAASSRFGGPLAAALGDLPVFEGTRRVDSPIHRLMRQEQAATLQLHHRNNQLERVIWQGQFGESAALRMENPTTLALDIELAASPGKPVLTLNFTYARLQRGAETLHLSPTHFADAIQALYLRLLVDGNADSVALFATACDSVTVGAQQVAAYAALAGAQRASERAPNDLAFSLAWKALFAVLACPELSGGWLRLLHVGHRVRVLDPRGLHVGDTVSIRSQATRIADSELGRAVTSLTVLSVDGIDRLELGTDLLIRSPHQALPKDRASDAAVVLRAKEPFTATLRIADAATWTFVQGHDWLGIVADPPQNWPQDVRVVATLEETRFADGQAMFAASGTLVLAGQVLAEIDLVPEIQLLREHPLRALAGVLAPANEVVATPRRTLATLVTQAPMDARTFADVGGDRNPIHASPLAARLAGLAAPIVHGMWTAARLHQWMADLCGGDAGRIQSGKVDFLSTVAPGEALRLQAVRSGMSDGSRQIEATAFALRASSAMPVARTQVSLAPPKTAYVFPGQGIQRQGMGMEGYARSRAAKSIWDRADAFTRQQLGFSVLHVVRQNPKTLDVRGEQHVHPEGVLHLTQYTQVAMAVLAIAQVAELRQAGVLDPNAIACGHSVGEYDALSAYVGVLPLESVVDIVWQRGCTMHTVVPRDAQGRSAYRMGVIRPNLAGLDHAGAEALVAEVAQKSGQFVQIVNHNVRNRQYSVTGEVGALEMLERELVRRTAKGNKAAWIVVPGIDVPFHSSVLRDAVPAFRRVLDDRFPPTFDPAQLVGRYVPNLIAKPFALDRPFVQEVRDASQSPELQQVLDDPLLWHDRPGELARLLLVELLAWQFASPVRWIETQELLLTPVSGGGMGVQRIIEIGVGHQPTLMSMAKASLEVLGTAAPRVEIRNAEADLDIVLERDTDPEVAVPVAANAPTPSAAAKPAAAIVQAPPVVAVQLAAPSGPAPDRVLTLAEALKALLALQSRMKPEQVRDGETIDELFEGVSSRRNQALLDVGAEFSVGAMDGAHEKQLPALTSDIAARNTSYRAPGRYLRTASDEAFARLLGRTGMSRKDATGYLESSWGLNEATADGVLLTLALETRPGESSRAGKLGSIDDPSAGNRAQGQVLLDTAVAAWAQRYNAAVARAGQAGAASGGGIVDAAAVAELADKIMGVDGALMKTARDLAGHLGHTLDAAAAVENAESGQKFANYNVLTSEMGAEFAKWIAPRFSAQKHVAFSAPWATAQRAVVKLWYAAANEGLTKSEIDSEVTRLRAFAAEPRVADTALWFSDKAAARGLTNLSNALKTIASPAPRAPVPVAPSEPHTAILPDGRIVATEIADDSPDALVGWIEKLAQGKGPLRAGKHVELSRSCIDALLRGAKTALDFSSCTALVTGASPGSIALEMTRHLLRGGAKVVLTTSSYDRKRMAFYRKFAQLNAGPDAELHVVPYNQASTQDTEMLLQWLAGPVNLQPDLLIPFGAIKDAGSLDSLTGKAEVAVRAMLLGVERLIAGIGRQRMQRGDLARPCHVVLPLSPNHGQFGGDGTYAETKAGLETLVNRWHSEQVGWAKGVTLATARIGWVRGTGLMDANDAVASLLESSTGVRTYSSAEMGFVLAGLCDDVARLAAQACPLAVDLTGGFGDLADVRGTVDGLRRELTTASAAAKRLTDLSLIEADLLKAPKKAPALRIPLGTWPKQLAKQNLQTPVMPRPKLALDKMVVIVGLGELSPGGSARTRFELETRDELSPAACIELAWLMGLIRWETRRGWIDMAADAPIAESEIPNHFADTIAQRSGVRAVNPTTAGFDPAQMLQHVTVYLDRDISFVAATHADAQQFAAMDPRWTRIAPDGDAWRVTRLAGAEVRVPRALRLSRRVAGLLPDGLDFARLGIPRDMLGSTDPTALMDLTATADAFVTSGLEPEELLGHLHPSRVGNTQGSGIGGMKSLRKLYLDPVLGNERQNDALQETLINVMGAYAVQSYVGSYGPMSHPVGACATAALSYEQAIDKLLLDRADFIVAGGFDDYGPEGAVGFMDMNATASTDDMLAMGLEPQQMSRPNDLRRKGFVEAQGGGTALLTRGDIALKLGLPVLGVLAYAGSYGDGVHRSIPAPGLGVLASALGGADSPLGRALAAHSLTADDIAIVSKHDTSTNANDPNESSLHQTIQQHLGRTKGNPLYVISQKSLTGHAKGGAAAWQLAGLCQAMSSGIIPGNRHLESVDPALRGHNHLCWGDSTLETQCIDPLRAGFITSLGFGHVGAICLVLHADAFRAALSDAERSAWDRQSSARLDRGRRKIARVIMGEGTLYERRGHRRFAGSDGSDSQHEQEAAMLLDPTARLGSDGKYRGSAT